MRHRINELVDELDQLRKEKTAFERLEVKMLAHEAAMRVIARHGLWEELAKEMQVTDRLFDTDTPLGKIKND